MRGKLDPQVPQFDSRKEFMIYLVASLLILACTPLIVGLVLRFERISRILAGILMLGIVYNIVTHIILENVKDFGWGAIAAALAGMLIFGIGDAFFFGQSHQRNSRIFIILVQIFLCVHAMIDGAAFVGSDVIGQSANWQGHQHGTELSISILIHRLLFEVFVWKFFFDRFGRIPAAFVLINVALGTVLGFFGSRALFELIPSYFGLFEAFIGGALLHLVYDYFKERLTGRTCTLPHVVSSPVLEEARGPELPTS